MSKLKELQEQLEVLNKRTLANQMKELEYIDLKSKLSLQLERHYYEPLSKGEKVDVKWFQKVQCKLMFLRRDQKKVQLEHLAISQERKLINIQITEIQDNNTLKKLTAYVKSIMSHEDFLALMERIQQSE